jgi:hypothetical protein
MFATDDLMSSTSEKRIPFCTLLSFGNSQKSAGANQKSTADDPWQRCLFVLKSATLKAKNVPACCHGEESMSDLSTALSCVPHSINKPFQHLHIERPINGGPLGCKFKVDYTPDVEKECRIVLILDFDIHGFFGLGIHHKLFLTSVTFHLEISAV